MREFTDAGQSAGGTSDSGDVGTAGTGVTSGAGTDAVAMGAAAGGAGTGEAAEESGRHPEAPPKSDFEPNPGKELLLPAHSADGQQLDGCGWARFPLRVDLIARGDDLVALAATRVSEFCKALPDAPRPVQALARGGRWYLFLSEKVVAVSQGRIYLISEINPGPWARTLSRWVVRTPYGIGLGHPATMQLAIQEIGLPRILLAALVSVAGKAIGRRGWFYRVAGPNVRAIDGPTHYSAYPANVSAKLAPADPDGVARKISAAVRAALPADQAADFGGTVVIDANDIGRNVLGHDTDCERPDLEAAFADNPLGQARQQTPLAIVVRHGSVPAPTGAAGTPQPGARGGEKTSRQPRAKDARQTNRA